jgi:hypothetical protein
MKRLGIRHPGDPPPPENVLGDWYANILYTRHGHYVLLVSERSLLPILTTARDLDNLVPRFMKQLADVLAALGIRRGLIDRELSRMEPLYFGRTNSRSVLGTMNDFVVNFKYALSIGRDYSPLDWSLRLAITPCGPIDMQRPMDLARRLLENPHGFTVINGGES